MKKHYSQLIEAVVFDIGEVLVKLDFSPVLRELGLPPSLPLYEALGRLEGWNPFDSFERGTLSKEEFLKTLSSLAGRELSWECFLPIWNSVIVGPFPLTEELLKKLSSKVPLFALTNSNEFHYKFLKETYPWMSYFAQVFSSHLIGARKPEDKVFRHVLETIRLLPSKILFIDDRFENVKAAKTLGFVAELCEQLNGNLFSIVSKHGFVC